MWSCVVPPRLCCQVIYVHWSRRIRIRTLPDRLEKANISYISARRRDRDEISTNTPAFLGSSFSIKLLQTLLDETGSQKFNMAAAKPDVVLTPEVNKIAWRFRRTSTIILHIYVAGIIAEHLIYNDICGIQNCGQKTGSSYHFGYI